MSTDVQNGGVGLSAPVQSDSELHSRHGKGPDHVVESDEYFTWLRDHAVRLRTTTKGPASKKPQSVMSMFKRTVDKAPRRPAIAVKVGDHWEKWTYKAYYERVQTAARAFIKLGLEPLHGVGIIGFNSPHWFIADLAAIFAGGFACGIYTTNNPEACHYVADNADCNIIVVEDDVQLQKILLVRSRLPHLKAIVQYAGKSKQSYPGVYSWKEFMALGTHDLDDELERRIDNQAPNKCCTLIYTSGTTGTPKGVMISHDNFTWTIRMLMKMLKVEFGTESVVTYLPLSHAAAQLIDLYGSIMAGATVYFAQPDALKGSLVNTMREVRPTTFLGVPRVWEKMHEAMVAAGKSQSNFKRKIALWAKDVGLQGNMAYMNGGSRPLKFGLADRLVFSKVRSALGLERCKLCISGAAPIAKDILQFFLSLNIPIMEVYGMSESSGPHTVGIPLPSRFCISSVGKEFPGATTYIHEPDKDGNGEVCMIGRHVFMGYLNMEGKTREVLDSEGRLHSGDIGRIDDKGFLYITGRIKELIITAGGENIPPVPIEDKVRAFLPCVSNCMLIGDKRKFLSMLLTLKTELDPQTQDCTDELSKTAKDWCSGVGSMATRVTHITKDRDPAAMKGIQAGIDLVNKHATSRAQNIQKWTVLSRDFTTQGGELGPTLKLKRSVVATMYKDVIDEFYAGDD